MKTVRKVFRNVMALHPDDTVDKAWRLMRDQGLGGLPVMDDRARVIGMLTEDDLLARCIPRKPLRWWSMMVSQPDQLADAYRKAVGTVVADVMSDLTASVGLDETVEAAARLMRDQRLRMLPVIAEGVLAGIVTAVDLVDDAVVPPTVSAALATDAELVEAMQRRLDDEPWASRHGIRITAHHAVIELDGLVNTVAERRAIVAMARTIPGSLGVEDHLLARAELARNEPPFARVI